MVWFLTTPFLFGDKMTYMNISKYVNVVANKTFDKLPFSEVDALVFSELSYINFDLLVPPDSFMEMGNLIIDDKKATYAGGFTTFQNNNLLQNMMKSKRYSKIKVGRCVSIRDDTKLSQFYAMTFILPNTDMFIVFRGTDTSVVGWKEDLELAYKDKLASHDLAKEYVDSIAHDYPDNKFYVGGHSKGGNLAFYACLYMDEDLLDRLIKGYSFDGPGFRQDIKKLNSFKILGKRLEKYITTNDLIGIIYNNYDNIKVVYSNNSLFLGGHDPFSWKVDNDTLLFDYTKKRSKFSMKNEDALMAWLRSLTDDQKSLAVEVIGSLFGEAETVGDLLKKGIKTITDGKRGLDQYSKEEKRETINIFMRLMKFYAAAFAPRIAQKKEKIPEIDLQK